MSLTDDLDLSSLRLSSGQGRRLELDVPLAPVELGGQTYAVPGGAAHALLDVSRTTGPGYALRLRLEAELHGPCMRCLAEAGPAIAVDAREVDQPGGGDELSSPYVKDDVLDLAGWAHDALVLALPAQVLCRADCAGLCPVCAVNLNEAEPGHAHEREPDPRWAALRGLRLE